MTKLPELYTEFLNHLVLKNKISTHDQAKIQRLYHLNSTDTPLLLLHKLGLCSESDIANELAITLNLPLTDKDSYPKTPPPGTPIPERFFKFHHLVCLTSSNESITVSVFDPLDNYLLKGLKLATSKQINLQIGLLSDIEEMLEVQFGEGKSQIDIIVDSLAPDNSFENDDIEHLADLASEAPIIKMVNFILQKAMDNRASDIHIEPFEEKLQIRLRIDGVLHDIKAPPVSSSAAVISRIKIMAKLNIAERRLPQDGRIKLQLGGRDLDLRISTIPTLYGESIVIRLLDKDDAILSFQELGFSGPTASNYLKTLNKPNGIILITGPTGSGKSTSLYTSLKQLHTPERKIITVEDPVEYQLEGVNQIQVKPTIGLTFANALRSIVRQDPDIIMIGEMRDLETAKIAVQSALTGHLVLSTLHTNDAASGITRLLDMGLDDYLLTSTINGILAQRLVRRLCEHCKSTFTPDASYLASLGVIELFKVNDNILYKANGCEHCNGLGYKGRLAIIEFLCLTEGIKRMILNHEDAAKIQEAAMSDGMLTMFQDGISKALEGLTTIDEVIRLTHQ